MSSGDSIRLIQQMERRIAKLEAQSVRPSGELDGLVRAIATLQMHHGVVGIWGGAATNGNGEVVDYSGNGNHLSRSATLIDGSSVDAFPRLYFSGTSSYAQHVDSADFDVTGLESNVASGIRGLTLGIWIKPNSLASTQQIASKYQSSSDRAYWLDVDTSGNARFNISNTGSDVFTVIGSGITTSAYHHVVCRFTPSAELAVWVDGIKFTNETGIPASIFDSTGPFRIGQRGDGVSTGANLRILLCYLCKAAVPDAVIEAHYHLVNPLIN